MLGAEALGRLGHEHEQRRVGEDGCPYERPMALGQVERYERAAAVASDAGRARIKRAQQRGGVLRLLLDRRAEVGLRSAA